MQDRQAQLDTRHAQRVINALQKHLALYGYRLTEIPVIENADLFLTKAGDHVAEKLFTFERHGRNLALRPEFTAAAAYLYAAQGHDEIVRWQFSGPVFEDDPQDVSGKYQRYSAGAELIGLPGPAAEAEIISLAAQGLLSQGINDWQLIIGHVGLTRHLLGQFGLDSRTERFILSRREALKDSNTGKVQILDQLNQHFPTVRENAAPIGGALDEINTQQMLDVLLDAGSRGETMGGRTRNDIARRLLQKRKQAAQRDQINAALDFLQVWTNINGDPQVTMSELETFAEDDSVARRLLREWQDVMNLLEIYHIPTDRIIIQPDLARTWDYYTGLVFELHIANGLQVAGGGRYDELIRLLGGAHDVPAVGFAYYVDRLLESVPPPTETGGRVFHLTGGDDTSAAAWAYALRQRGISVVIGEAAIEYSTPSLRISSEGHLQWEQRTFAFDEIDSLTDALDRW